uniref:Uncharacterized protein n=1 Tax=Oryza sativa subsp. japonica TaxID=39947 RepID=Q6YYI5_ORYSJ|nr:hypothetical protein [Oryza sativa Japonica Group]BAD16243.1 hypothetical protein [Oryza sativa Japonica Group]
MDMDFIADWFVRPHGRPTTLLLIATSSSPTVSLPSLLPTGFSAYTAGLLCRRWWASLSPSTAFVAADWCLHCY